MATRTWRGAVSNDWHDSANWAENAVPTAADDVVIDCASTGMVAKLSAEGRCKDLVQHCASCCIVDTGGYPLYINGSLVYV